MGCDAMWVKFFDFIGKSREFFKGDIMHRYCDDIQVHN